MENTVRTVIDEVVDVAQNPLSFRRQMEPASSLRSPHAMDGHDMAIVKVVNLCT
jgi:hypothetical protein